MHARKPAQHLAKISVLRVTEILDGIEIISPVFFDLHPKFQIYLASQKPFYLDPGALAYAFQFFSVFTDNDPLVIFARSK